MKTRIAGPWLVHSFASSVAAALVLCAVVTSCTDDVLAPSHGEEASSGAELSEYQINPHAVLSSGRFSGAPGMAAGGHAKNSHNGFASPLFGLATAPNGDILVADAGAGVATLDGATDIPLPGITDMSPLGRGSLWGLVGLTGDPGDDTGQGLYRATRSKNRLIVDLFAFEAANDPDGKGVDSNPFDVHSLGGRAALVVDAGGNDLLRVDNQGNVEVLATFPDALVSTANVKSLVGCPASGAPLCGLPAMIPAQAVPTSIAVGPDGYIYVGELKGFPAPAGASNIWKVAPDASGATCGSSPECVKAFDGGFTSIIDLAFDASGALHVAELDAQSWFAVEVLPPGALAGGTINACDVGTGMCSEVATGIPILTAITFGKDGSLWATKNALIPGLAEVVEVPLP